MTAPGERSEPMRRQEAELERLREQLRLWEEAFGATPTREALFSASSGIDVEPLYTPADRASGQAYTEALGVPGQYPFTRGPYASMYRTRLWTMRQFAGFATAEDTNQR